MTKVICFGTFDGLHKGHLNYFQQAKKLGDYLVVVVARDINVKKIKGKLPKQNEQTRLKTVDNYPITDESVLGNIKNKISIIKKIKPDIITLGYDQKADVEFLQKKFPQMKIVKLKAYKPNVYKSSILNRNS